MLERPVDRVPGAEVVCACAMGREKKRRDEGGPTAGPKAEQDRWTGSDAGDEPGKQRRGNGDANAPARFHLSMLQKTKHPAASLTDRPHAPTWAKVVPVCGGDPCKCNVPVSLSIIRSSALSPADSGRPAVGRARGPVRLLPRSVSRFSSSPRRFAGCERAEGGEPAATVPANAGFTKAGSNNKSGSPPGRTAAVGRDPLRRGSTKNEGTDNQEVRRMGCRRPGSTKT